ncbi:Uncharacterised protein [Nocardia otitidiscaviarum]|uniref:Uncharacterized protein n=1 Tax=Nocardia otitidiscaviarum TaxID=1823 RepID=A0A378YFQ3_9NOCA|nr:hypothetical protein [Nocardia otitidiscaviarum]SUA76016.1 Uncharacterised protein [Nocardia otitidiscaviarum]
MDILAIVLIVAGVLAALTTHEHRPPRHRYGRSVADLQARLAAESAGTFVPLRGW